jgi:pimeloyl-ACP methyl ester carboxylesterase
MAESGPISRPRVGPLVVGTDLDQARKEPIGWMATDNAGKTDKMHATNKGMNSKFTFAVVFLVALIMAQPQTANAMTPQSNACSTNTGLYCEMHGSGDPVLFIHGLGASMFTWRKLVDPLKTDYQLFLIDLKGFGKSPKPKDKKYAVQDHADLLYKFIVEHDLKKLTIVGNSYGGAVSLLLAITLIEKDKDRLSKLILIDSGGYKKHLPWHVKLLRTPLLGWLALHVFSSKRNARMILKFSYYNDDLIEAPQVDEYAAGLAAPGGKSALLRTAKQAIPKNIKELIAKYPNISVPTLIIWGQEDEVIPQKIGEMLDTAIPCSKLVVIPATGHVPQEETPDKTIPLIRDFLKNSITCPQ